MPAFVTGRLLGKFRGASLRIPLLLVVALTVSALAFTGSGCRPYKKGEALYKIHCANCHMPDGTGLEGNIPPLASSDYFSKNPVAAACIIRNGLQDTIRVNGRVYSQPMAAIPKLSELEITNIINYIGHSWGNRTPYLSLANVRKALEECN
ncbi:MAG: cytochrome c [Haliscomenobacter sp.]|nr:cytochrome c [Haliscomenobacter sp.]MBK7474719.1 cytochrome c [Haliscomenobacter sp.]MBK8877633.1 cytochrome c [Haliscomenobacter sp.]